MKYIVRKAYSSFDTSDYEDYLDRVRDELAPRIHGPELLTTERFWPTGPSSFHDARFDRFTAAAAEAIGGQRQALSVELRLKGPYFDRHFELSYKEVLSCTFQLPSTDDDLLMHELRAEDGVLVHECLFAGDKVISISCRELHFVEALEDKEPPAES